MYEAYFGLQQEPFSIAPDPRFLYMSDKHREALALLNFGLTRGASFVLLTGEIGAGKTTVWRRFLESLPANVDVANVVNPKLDVVALLGRICEDLRVPLPEAARPVDLIDALHGHLLLAHAQGRRTLIVIDEAQALSGEVLEQLRLLTNLDTSGRKLQVMLIGQPEMRQILERPELEPLAQRIVARYHLPALSDAETAGYISHRMTIAGYSGPLPFEAEAVRLIHHLCRGVPRRINVLCDRALAAAQAAGRRHIGPALVLEAAAQVFGQRLVSSATAPPAPAAAAPAGARRGVVVAAVGAVALGVGIWLGPRWAQSPVVAKAPPAPPPASAGMPPPMAIAAPVAASAGPGLESAFGAAAADEAPAWRSLASLWGVTLGAGEPCSAAARQGLQCWRTRGGLAPIRQLDRPGLLRLADDQGRVAHVLLTALDGDVATLSIGGRERQLPVAELARWWRGEFATLWRPPPGYREGEVAGSWVAPPAWIAQRLALVEGPRASALADEPLRARITAFQLAQGLTPDGVAGPLTLMQLSRASGIAEPRLAGATSGSRPS